jgi:hypothetical protein
MAAADWNACGLQVSVTSDTRISEKVGLTAGRRPLFSGEVEIVVHGLGPAL